MNALERLALAAALVLGVAPSASALDPTKVPTQYVIQVWRAEDGLPQNSIQTICQTRDGYLWLGTQEGLARFDGVRFTVFDRKTAPALGSNFIQALLEDRDGTLFVGTQGGGLALLSDGVWTSHGEKEGLAGHSVQALAQGGDGAVWAATSGGLTRIHQGRLTSNTSARGLSALLALPGSSHELLVASYRDGLHRYDGGAFQPPDPALDALPDRSVFALARSKDGALWIGTSKGLARLSAGTLTTFGPRDGFVDDQVNAILEDRDSSVWIGTEGSGLYRLHAGAFTHLGVKEGLSSNSVRALYEDREGALFIGTDGGGLARLKDGRFTPIGALEGLANDAVYSVLETRDGVVWVGTKGGGLQRIDGGAVTLAMDGSVSGGSSGYAMAESKDGALWLGTDQQGLLRFAGGRVTERLGTREGLPSAQVFSALEDTEGALWAGTADGLAVRGGVGGRGASFARPDVDGALPRTAIFAIAQGRDGALYAGTLKEGLLSIRGRVVTRYGAAQGLPGDTVLSLSHGKDGSLWIGTYGGGLARLKDGRLTSWGTADGLFSDLVYQALEDDGGRVFMSCNKGISSVRIADLEAHHRSSPPIPTVVYGRGDGLRNPECNGSAQPAGVKTKDGRLLFPTMGGLASIAPSQKRKDSLRPWVHVEEALVDGRAVSPSELALGITIAPGRRRALAVRYTGISLLAPERVTFRYRLQGFDPEEVDAGSRRVAYYTNVPPGRYVFRVTAANEDGVASAEGASLAVRVEPRFHETPFFLAVLALAAGAAGWGVYALRVRRLRAEFAVVLKERSRMAREIHDTLAQGLTGVLLQLQAASQSLEEDPPSAEEHVARARQLASGSLDEARRSIWSLRSEALQTEGLRGALERAARQMGAGKDVAIEVTSSGDARQIPAEVEGELFRIGQEALWNALKYAEARHIWVEVGADRRNVWVRVKDDGKGFDPERAAATVAAGGFGLSAMRERAERLGGRLVVASRPGDGASVAAEIPRKK